MKAEEYIQMLTECNLQPGKHLDSHEMHRFMCIVAKETLLADDNHTTLCRVLAVDEGKLP